MLYIPAKLTVECGCCQSPVRGAPMQKAASKPDDSEDEDFVCSCYKTPPAPC